MKIKKNGKIIRLTESDLKKIVKRVLTEQEEEWRPNAGWEGKTYYDQDETGNIIDDEGRIIRVAGDEDPDMNYHRSPHTDDDSEYEWAQDSWGYLQNPTDNDTYEDEDDFEEVASFDDYDEYIKSGYCHPHDNSCMNRRVYFDKRKDMLGDLKISRRHKKR